MITMAYILAACGLVALVWGALQRHKAAHLAGAPLGKTGDAARGAAPTGPKGALGVEGAVECATPLAAPASGTPCVYYELEVTGYWKEGDSTKSKKYVSEKRAASFAIDDGSGAVAIDASKGGDFDLDKTFDETKKEGFFADLKGAVGKADPIVFGGYAFHNPAMSAADRFECVERVVRVHPRMFACGKLAGGVLASPDWASLVLSSKSRDELLGATAKAAKAFLAGGAASLAVGVVLGVVGNLM
jgi:hypothetical protein